MITKLAVVFTALVAFGLQVARAQPVTVPAFYVATNGSDSNPGTLEAPFLTLTKCQRAMRGSSTTTCYIRAGTYTPASSGTSCGDSGVSQAVILTASDNGETWSYYPPDGYGTAIINGQASGSTGLGIGICSDANDVTVNGLAFVNFQISGIETHGSSALIENNTINNITNTSTSDACLSTQDAANSQIIHNIVMNCPGMGIGVWPTSAQGAQNLFIAYNYVYNACSAIADCGGIYIEDYYGEPETGQVIGYNYVANVGGGGGGEPIYLDDNSSNVTVLGNVLAPQSVWQCYFVHGGSNNTATGNICDLGNNPAVGIANAQQETETMSGNSWTNNIILAATSSSAVGGAYNCNTDPCQMIIGPNAYFNYAGSSVASSGSLGSDSYPVYENPNFTSAWTYTLPSNSPVYGSLVSFPMQPPNWGSAGFWGPPGFVIPHTGTPPSMVVSTAALTAFPISITSGQSSTLTWSSTNATSCTGTGFTASGTSGSATVSPTTNTTYSVTCGGASVSATVIVGFLRRRR